MKLLRLAVGLLLATSLLSGGVGCGGPEGENGPLGESEAAVRACHGTHSCPAANMTAGCFDGKWYCDTDVSCSTAQPTLCGTDVVYTCIDDQWWCPAIIGGPACSGTSCGQT